MICTLTINAAIDRLLFIDQFRKNQTNRIQKTVEVLGGKGTHVSLNLSTLGLHSRSFGVAFGKVGRQIQEILHEQQAVDVQFLHYANGSSRINYAIIEDDHTCSLVAEKGTIIARDVCLELIGHIDRNINAGDYIVLSGDASNTEIPHIYNVIIERLAPKGVKVFLDSSSENLTEGLKAKPFLVKPNQFELSQIAGRPVDTEADILTAMEAVQAGGVEVVAVSCGKNGSYVSYGGDTYRVLPLPVDVSNTIGCGDAYLTGLVCGFYKGMPIEDTLRLAAALSGATAESELTVGFDPKRAADLTQSVEIRKY